MTSRHPGALTRAVEGNRALLGLRCLSRSYLSRLTLFLSRVRRLGFLRFERPIFRSAQAYKLALVPDAVEPQAALFFQLDVPW